MLILCGHPDLLAPWHTKFFANNNIIIRKKNYGSWSH